MTTVDLKLGDSREVLKTIPENTIPACVCDPPYALVSISQRFGKEGAAPAQFGADGAYRRASSGFMGRTWDTGTVAFDPEFWAEVLRVLKPGAHLLAFGSTRTYHRLVCSIEDAGFEIRDTIAWHYGQGFPKSHNLHGENEGWGTALKPATELICLARKPLSEKSVAANVERWGTAALNIDACRIEGTKDWPTSESTLAGWKKSGACVPTVPRGEGRWPANAIFSPEMAVELDMQSGVLTSGKRLPTTTKRRDGITDLPFGVTGCEASTGGASRFFYVPKPDRAEREAGCEAVPESADTPGALRDGLRSKPTRNIHPTVKPHTLLQYLCRLITPPGGVVLDPFMGSGSCGMAAVNSGFGYLGIELEEEYFRIAQARLLHSKGETGLFAREALSLADSAGAGGERTNDGD